MELSLKPQSISLITCNPMLLPLSPRSVRSQNSEFLSLGHNLRPPGSLRSRRKCRSQRFKFHTHAHKFRFRASLEAQPILVASAVVVSVSAITLVYLNYSIKQINIKQVSRHLTVALSQQISNRMKWGVGLWGSNRDDVDKEAPADERKDSMKDLREISQDYTKTVSEMPSGETYKYSGGTLIMDTFDSHSNMVASSGGEFSSFKKLEDTDISSAHSALSDGHLDARGRQNVVAAELSMPNVVAAELSMPVVETEPTIAASKANNLQVEVNKLERTNFELSKQCDTRSNDLILGESVREGLHTFYEASLGNSDGLETLSSAGALQKKNFALQTKSFSVKDKFVRKGPLRCFKEGSFSEQKDSTGRKEGKTDKETRTSHQDSTKHLSLSFDLKGNHANHRHNSFWQLRVYQQLLKENRLSDCIEMLEDMERKGLLDMDKVYHSRFFHACKSQKAVNEAFRFTMLIPNPTLSTFNMLMSVCASSQDSEGAFQVLQHVQEARLKADCKLYTTLISTCAKSGKVDTMFKVFHEMVNAGVEPNVNTYGALIDGCAKAGQVAKAFGAYGILRSKNVKPDRVVFNALITACGQSGAVDRAFDVLAEMGAEAQPIDPDHITIGALMKACASAGQVDRAREVYNMIHKYNIKGTAELYTIAVNSCSQNGDWEFACCVYNDMIQKGVAPDEMFISALIDVAGHAGRADAAVEVLQAARTEGMHVGIITYSSLMGAFSKAKDWQKALEFYQEIKSLNLKPTVPMMNALITALCDADKLEKATEVLLEMKSIGLCPNTVTYSVLLVASEKKDDIEVGLTLLSEAKKDGVAPNLVMCRCLIAMCLRRYQKACTSGEPVLPFSPRRLHLDNTWTSLALMVYRETILSGVTPAMDELSQVLGCLRLPHDEFLRNRLVENFEFSTDKSKGSNLYSLIDGFGEYDPRAISLLEEAASLGVIPLVSFKDSPIVVDVRNFQIHTAEVYLLTVLKGLKHRLAAGAKLPNVNILLPVEKTQIQTSTGEKTISIASSQAVAALLRRLGLTYQGNESFGKIRINGVSIKKWFQPKLNSPFRGKATDFNSFQARLGRGIIHQQRNIRTGNLSLE
ncbi:pentatricopeptide repeat-containing MRL1, chloroplastic [Olea europaea subsp. europaea]|uniref:Pentatricopeptide repeat-containing MRL1, chloroplastic n=1 Tax=Olea europaea subsp. europaea TaxID=158383 RepID=A0A8S0TYA1_OLEEU|nr:pentatricopeptide repeat-containing MRL1, chloroplastic [Olea europaea subsp. europaea]